VRSDLFARRFAVLFSVFSVVNCPRDDVERRSKRLAMWNRNANQVSQKLRKSSPARALIASKANFPENIFVAKKRDSESAKRVFRVSRSYARFYWGYGARCIRMKEVPAAQWFLSLSKLRLSIVRRARCDVLRMHRNGFVLCLQRVQRLVRKHFLKRDAVFLNALV